MIVKKCEHLNCAKAGTCRCPKDRSLKEYWNFCQAHAAEYNKNWNYYKGMTDEEINAQWEKDTFGGAQSGDAAVNCAGPEYQKLIHNFIRNRKMPVRSTPPNIMSAFETLGLKPGDGWDKIQKKYRALAKENHPDTGKSKDQSRFVKISSAYQALKKYLGK